MDLKDTFYIIWTLSDHLDTYQIIRTLLISSRGTLQIEWIVKALFISSRQFQIIWTLFKSFGHFEYHPNTLRSFGDFPDYFDTLQALVHCLALRLVTSSEGGGDTEEDKKKVSIMMLM